MNNFDESFGNLWDQFWEKLVNVSAQTDLQEIHNAQYNEWTNTNDIFFTWNKFNVHEVEPDDDSAMGPDWKTIPIFRRMYSETKEVNTMLAELCLLVNQLPENTELNMVLHEGYSVTALRNFFEGTFNIGYFDAALSQNYSGHLLRTTILLAQLYFLIGSLSGAENLEFVITELTIKALNVLYLYETSAVKSAYISAALDQVVSIALPKFSKSVRLCIHDEDVCVYLLFRLRPLTGPAATQLSFQTVSVILDNLLFASSGKPNVLSLILGVLLNIRSDGHPECILKWCCDTMVRWPTTGPAVFELWLQTMATDDMATDFEDNFFANAARIEFTAYSLSEEKSLNIVKFIVDQLACSSVPQHRSISLKLASAILSFDEDCCNVKTFQHCNAIESAVNLCKFDMDLWTIVEKRDLSLLSMVVRRLFDNQSSVKTTASIQLHRLLTGPIRNEVVRKFRRSEESEDITTITCDKYKKLVNELDNMKNKAIQGTFFILENSDHPVQLRRVGIPVLEYFCCNTKGLHENARFQKIINNLLKDNSILIRQASVQFVTNIFKTHYRSDGICQLWCNSIISTLDDPDEKIRSSSVLNFQSIIVNDCMGIEISSKLWDRFLELTGERRQCVKTKLTTLMVGQKVSDSSIQRLLARRTVSSFQLVSVLSRVLNTAQVSAVIHVFGELFDSPNDVNIVYILLKIIHEVFDRIRDKACLLQLLVARFSTYKMQAPLIGPALALIRRLADTLNESRLSTIFGIPNGNSSYKQWISGVTKDIYSSLLTKRGEPNLLQDDQFLLLLLHFGHLQIEIDDEMDDISLNILTFLLEETDKIIKSFGSHQEQLNIFYLTMTLLAIRRPDWVLRVSKMLYLAVAKGAIRGDGVIDGSRNAIHCMEDLCRRHTAIVEPFFDQMATQVVCAKNPQSAIIRHQLFGCIGRLLIDDYLKLRENLLFLTLYHLIDESEWTNALEIIMSYVTRPASGDSSVMISQWLLEAPMAFNVLTQHRMECFGPVIKQRRCLYGDEMKVQRNTIYAVLAKCLAPVQRFIFFRHLPFVLEKVMSGPQSKELHTFVYDFVTICAYICQLNVIESGKNSTLQSKFNKIHANSVAKDDENGEEIAIGTVNGGVGGVGGDGTMAQQRLEAKQWNELTRVIERTVQLLPEFHAKSLELLKGTSYYNPSKTSLKYFASAIFHLFPNCAVGKQKDWWNKFKDKLTDLDFQTLYTAASVK